MWKWWEVVRGELRWRRDLLRLGTPGYEVPQCGDRGGCKFPPISSPTPLKCLVKRCLCERWKVPQLCGNECVVVVSEYVHVIVHPCVCVKFDQF